jgi:hypothetical protein
MTSWLWLWLVFSAHAELVDRIVAVVGDQLVLSSEIALEEVISKADTPDTPFWRPHHKTSLERLTEAALVRHTAGDIAIYNPSEDEVQGRIETIRHHFKDRGSWTLFLEKWMLDDATLRVLVRRRIVVERYLSRNISIKTTDERAWLRACDHKINSLKSSTRVRLIANPKAP